MYNDPKRKNLPVQVKMFLIVSTTNLTGKIVSYKKKPDVLLKNWFC